MSIVPPCYRDENVPEYTRSGASVPIDAGNKITLSTDGAGANGSVQFNKDVDGLLFASLGKQDIVVETNPAANTVSLTNDILGFDPLAVEKLYIMGTKDVATADGVAITGDYANGITIDNALTVNSLNGIPPGSIGRVSFSGTLSVPNGITPATAVSFGSQSFDFLDMWQVDTPTTFTIPLRGYYRLFASALFATSGTGARSITFRNTTSSTSLDVSYYPASSTNSTSVDIEGTYLFNAGTTLELWVGQSSGGALNCTQARWEYQFVRSA